MYTKTTHKDKLKDLEKKKEKKRKIKKTTLIAQNGSKLTEK